MRPRRPRSGKWPASASGSFFSCSQACTKLRDNLLDLTFAQGAVKLATDHPGVRLAGFACPKETAKETAQDGRGGQPGSIERSGVRSAVAHAGGPRHRPGAVGALEFKREQGAGLEGVFEQKTDATGGNVYQQGAAATKFG